MRFFFVITIVLATVPAEGEKNEETLAQTAYKLAADEAKSLTLKKDSQELELVSKPVLRWSNPLSGQVFGDVYVWTSQGRPEAIASIFKWFSPNTHMSLEFQSLSEARLTMTREDREVWTPASGVKMKLLANAGVPRDREFMRLQQMKALMSQFSAEAVDRQDPDKKWFLRPLSKPIFRYKSEGRNIVDGALFAFCQENTTNPEVILMMEAQKRDGKVNWYFALGRQNSLQLRVSRNNEILWDVPRLAPPWENIKLPDKPYINLTIRDQRN